MQYQLKRALQIKIHLKDILEELDEWHGQCVEVQTRDRLGHAYDWACLVDLQRILRKSIKFQKRFQKRHEKFHKLCDRQTIPDAVPDAANAVLQNAKVSYAFLNTFIANLTTACSKLEPWTVRVIIEQTTKFMDIKLATYRQACRQPGTRSAASCCRSYAEPGDCQQQVD